MSITNPTIKDPLTKLIRNTLPNIRPMKPYKGLPNPNHVRTGNYLLICPKCGSGSFYFDKKKDMFCCSSCKAKWGRVE